METTGTAPTPTTASKTTPRDFFFWLGAIIALYGSVSSLLALKFAYIDHFFPDVLTSYVDPYGGPVRIAMAGLIVLVPTMLILFSLIRRTIVAEAGKANIWVRRWALVFTLFLAIVTVLIDLVTLVNTFLGGEITIRFGLKVFAVLIVALATFFYFFLDIKGYWTRHGAHARSAAIVVGVAALATLGAGFFIIGSPSHVRDLRLDSDRVNQLSSIQSQITYYYQQKRTLPKTLDALNDPLTGFSVPTDPVTGESYAYEASLPLGFTLCATFSTPSPTSAYGRQTSPAYPGGQDENWQHGTGKTCFTRTIDPEKFPSLGKPTPVKGL